MSRLKILKSSLKKKEDKLDKKINEHFGDVASANGQPLNDKRNGPARPLCEDGTGRTTLYLISKRR